MNRTMMRRAVLATVGAAALGAGVLSAAGTATASSLTYYTAKPVCAPAKAGHATCFAMKRVKHTRDVAGAKVAKALPAALPVGPAGGYTPNDLATAYGVDNTAATTQTVGIVDAFDDPNALANLNTFDAHYGLPAETATSFKKVNQTGGTTPPTANAGWAGEESLDLDAVRGICHTCKIILVETNDNSYDNLGAGVNEAVALGATIVSNSYGGGEGTTLPSSTILADYKHPGVVITASSADHGYFDWDWFNADGSDGAPTTSSEAPAFPSSDNTVVAVGGTTLQLNDDGTRSGESVWNENELYDRYGYAEKAAEGASGGGCSRLFAAQKWQSSVANYSQTACGAKRLVADISALADPYTGYDIYDTYQSSGWQTYGGTSLASPLIAGMWALAGGSGNVAYPSLSLYGHYNSTPSTSVNDVTVGGNGFCDGGSVGGCQSFVGGSPNALGFGTTDCAWKADSSTRSAGTRACDAATGYDGPSGVGTPKGLSVFQALAPTAVITPPTSPVHGTAATFSGTNSTDPFPGGTITTYAWTFGDGSTGSGATLTHTYAAAGTYHVTLKVTDNYARSATVAVNVKVT